MSLGSGIGVSPIRPYAMGCMTDLFWAEGALQSRGNPHFYINQEETEHFLLRDGVLHPWAFTALPKSKSSLVAVNRDRVHMLIFSDEETNELYRRPPRMARLVLYFPLCVIQGEVPLLSEATVEDFLDFWRGALFPIHDAAIHYLVEGMAALPHRASLLYAHRRHLVGYFPRQ